MERTQKMSKLTFTINPNPHGYVVVCNEMPHLFTDTASVRAVDKTIKALLTEYIANFPDDARKKGIQKNIPIQTVWKGSPNSVALE